MTTTRQRGRHWEIAAETFLNKRGLRTIKRNHLARVGEIDLVMMDRDTLVFVEVRFRANDTHGCGAATVTRDKQRKLLHAARNYLAVSYDRMDVSCRFDVVAIGTRAGRTEFHWIRNAFEAW